MDKIGIKTEYETTLKENTYVHVGGKTDKFVPNLNMGKWSDECWLNINHPDVVTTEKESLIDGKTQIKIGDNTHRFYVDDNGDLEYDIVFDRQPKSDVVEFDLTFPEGLDFWYQDELTQKEIELGSERPDNVVGSYAVYWNQKNNQYKTGKFCHIYRPKLIDSKGVDRWAVLDISENKMSVTCDFTGLVFPVTLDPTIGYSTVGSSAFGGATLKIGTTNAAPATTGTTDTFHVAVAAVGALTGLKLGIYETTTDYDPAFPHSPRNQNLVEQVTMVASVSDDLSAAASGQTINANQWYWLGFIIETTGITVKYDTGGGTGRSSYVTRDTYGNEMVDPWTDAATASTSLYSIWVDYSAAPAGGIARSKIGMTLAGDGMTGRF